MMNTDKYMAFLKASECGSLSAAAEALHLTPSGVSRAVEALERELGLPLLYRKTSGVSPTPAGEELTPYIRRILQDESCLLEKARQLSGLETGVVRIGVAYGALYPWLAERMAEFQKLYPGIRFELENGHSSGLLQKVENRDCDLAVVSRRPWDGGWHPLLSDELVAVIPPHYAMDGSVPLSVFTKEAYIDVYPGEETDNALLFRENNITPRKWLSTADSNAMYSMVEAGLGVCINNRINTRAWRGNVKLLPLNPPRRVEIGIVFLLHPMPASERFVEFLRESPLLSDFTDCL